MPQPISYQHILNLLLNQYHDGRYLNGHPEVCEWLDGNPDKEYYIQQMPDEHEVVGYHNVRVWSSYSAYEESLKKRIETVTEREEPNEPNRAPKSLHPIVQKLYEACERKDLDLVFALKQQCRRAGVKFDKNKTDIRSMI